jgi:hypothetical protein
MTLKATWLWNGTAKGGDLAFGFSETWYTDDEPATLLQKMETFADVRVRIMAKNTTLYGYRISDTAPGSRAYTQRPRRKISAPRGNDTPNIPQDSALCQCLGTVGGTIKRFYFHNLPDGFVDDADFVAGVNMSDKARDLINLLQQGGFKFRYQLQNTANADIQSIDATGNVVLVQNLAGVAQGSYVQLYHVRGTDGRGKRGKYRVETATDERHVKLAHWPGDIVALSGKLRIVTYGFTTLQAVPAEGLRADPVLRPGSRKAGRPFGQLRGRAVARR